MQESSKRSPKEISPSERVRLWRINNRERYNAQSRKRYWEKREVLLETQRRFRKNHPEMSKEYRIKHYSKFPMRKVLKAINDRCNGYGGSGKKYYLGKGIKNYLNEVDLVYLWNRDKAWEMSKPSIDRIDSDGNYELENCRFIEFKVNCGRSNYKNGKRSKLINNSNVK